ncbi:glutamine--fructose-6-phosphate transaminase (isomerizing) [Candidatus Pantoea edessiphila]|uniref:Glutamine--fructose-6-phosphate aminotransferase [isomerizing] n=1 Tax=Candidatus Pantoea edessiphila TaxID=2044610 RepID=A0A2P5SX97_9GAMM|nr:glutamine--fructose-6-phosphate transaminase (isomerizing) [Candidatus Pantoea edessiphila]MBK4775844.1 glutamine--fructose-6-phosphate transaminase (isomerizing) [Pantoea sp. Edef]PPI86967.1 glutamine--fructose-6-phosphate transaminase (isomerizing) [Candidatus Pantoea edessiphila]
MCGIIGAVSQRNIANILLEGLLRLEYRGYDSAGLAIIDQLGKFNRFRCLGKVQKLIDTTQNKNLKGIIGLAHTRWATHGAPSEINAHPHLSEHIVIVHNGIIENHEKLRKELLSYGYIFSSETDTEVIAHLFHLKQKQHGGSLLEVVFQTIREIRGSFGIVVMDKSNPSTLVAARIGSPLVIGCGVDENFIASDQIALLSIANSFIHLEEGDVAEISYDKINIFNVIGNIVNRNEIKSYVHYDITSKGKYRHHMQKEIYEQPVAIKNTLKGRCKDKEIDLSELGVNMNFLKNIKHVQIIACGTSYNSGMVSRYWFESLANIPCDVEIASEFRYRKLQVRKNSLLIVLSQSGETADTLAALRLSKKLNYIGSLAICNVLHSSIVRESDLYLTTKSGIEIGVASTKTFSTQLIVLLMLVIKLGSLNGMNLEVQHSIIKAIQILPFRIEQVLARDHIIEEIAKDFFNKNHALFIGRGDHYPIAMEGALKLKEISYIHAEAYAAGELKHGPLALIDNKMPVIVIAPNNELLRKLKCNIEEIRTRGGLLYIFTDQNTNFKNELNMKIIQLPYIENVTAPIFYTIPLQLLSYYVAVIKHRNIDQPRNLAKSVTVE